ncbi:OsmC family protein [Kitasatospora sp. DSM 101779]|uniref:OsmC family protein n=1 Tax=Kitasatospora sp. DSM 101779 TaxID=2853165 RepID=UPI0021DABA9F|nr:OsmC family protein [Kitasatospora sp. DSM 101779]MCU7820983.1 OsmC family protein [Kitasatospora sp. DSM 101779]
MDTTTEAPAFVRSAAAVATSTGEDYRVEIRSGHHKLTADEPASVGGGDTATTPVGLLLSALGSCTAITLRMYAQRKDWPLQTVRVHLGYEKGPESSVRITRRIELLGDLDEAQRARLLEIADRTPVTRAVRGGTPIVEQHHNAAVHREGPVGTVGAGSAPLAGGQEAGRHE